MKVNVSKIKELIKASKKTQNEFAQEIGMATQTFKQYLSDPRKFTGTALMKTAQKLGVSVDELYIEQDTDNFLPDTTSIECPYCKHRFLVKLKPEK